MNPLDILDAILADWVSPRARRLIHSLLLLAAVVTAGWLASDGDWGEALIAAVAAFYAASNRSNTQPNLKPAGFDFDDPDDDLTYEQAGGQPFSPPVSGNQ